MNKKERNEMRTLSDLLLQVAYSCAMEGATPERTARAILTVRAELHRLAPDPEHDARCGELVRDPAAWKGIRQ